MKRTKRIASVLLALVMALSLITTACAAGETYSITIKNDAAGHTYEAYHISDGAIQIKAGVKTLSNIRWGSGVSAEGGVVREFNHRLGHFIGLSEHEAGDVSAVNTALLRPGMVFSIEPGIYLEGDVGVRIEDLVLVTEDGCEVLNRVSKELEILG